MSFYHLNIFQTVFCEKRLILHFICVNLWVFPDFFFSESIQMVKEKLWKLVDVKVVPICLCLRFSARMPSYGQPRWTRESLTFFKMICFYFSWITVQSLSRPPPRWSSHGETETKADPNYFHIRTAQRIGEGVPGDTLSWHLHAWRDCHEDRPHRSTCSGMYQPIWTSVYCLVTGSPCIMLFLDRKSEVSSWNFGLWYFYRVVNFI